MGTPVHILLIYAGDLASTPIAAVTAAVLSHVPDVCLYPSGCPGPPKTKQPVGGVPMFVDTDPEPSIFVTDSTSALAFTVAVITELLNSGPTGTTNE